MTYFVRFMWPTRRTVLGKCPNILYLLDIVTEVPFNEICTVKLKQRGHKTTAGTGDATQRNGAINNLCIITR